MFFKNLSVFRLTEQFDRTADELAEKLQAFAFKPCGPHDEVSAGFVPPVGSESLIHSVSDYMMVCLKKQTKVLPSSAVTEAFSERLKSLEDEQKKLSAKERRELKDEVVFELLAKALTTSKLIYAYIDVNSGFIVIDSASSGVTEDILSMLRRSLGSLPCTALNPVLNPSVVMTDWLNAGTYPQLVNIDMDAVFKSVDDEDKSVIRCKHQEMFCDEIIGHLTAGKMVASIALTYNDRMSFMLDDTLTIKKLKFLDAVYDDVSVDDIETPEQRFDADFAIMTGELTPLINAVISWFGGIVE